jgi:NTE family protein
MRVRQSDLGLALGGGAMLGVSHIAVLEVLEENGIRPGVVTGTSVGGFVAALYAAGISPARLRSMSLELKRDDLFAGNFTPGTFLLLMVQFFRDLVEVMSLLPRGLLTGARIRDYVDRYTGGKSIAQVTMPVGLVAVDLISGSRVVFTNRPPAGMVSGTVFVDEAPLGLAVQATTAIPGIFDPVPFKGMLLVDGGLAETVPVALARQLGARAVAAVNLIESNSAPEPRSITHVILRSVDLLTNQVVQHSLEGADLVIHPPAMQVELGDFSCVSELLDGGRAAALEALPALQGLLH